MTIVMLTLGTRGDVQPYVALGVHLQVRGHRVRICTCERFKEFITSHGLDYGYLDDGILQFIESDHVKKMIGSRKMNLFTWIRTAFQMLPMIKDMQRRMLIDQWKACQDADVLLYHPKALGGAHIGEKLSIPTFCVPPFPAYVPTEDFPMFVLGVRTWSGRLNRLSYSLTRRGQAMIAGLVNEFRKEQLGLPPRPRFSLEPRTLHGRPIPVMHPISPQVLKTPDDWPPHATLTGYWFLDADPDWVPPDDLVQFLDAGGPPVYIGFGSMVSHQPEKVAAIVLEAIEKAGNVRTILGRGWGGLETDSVPDNVHLIDSVPHDWLLPRCSAAVHHGGAGSVAASLRAGLPTLVVPHIADQPMWGKQVHDRGLGPEPISKKQLIPDILARRIREMLQDTAMQASARSTSERIRSEDGTEAAIRFMNRFSAGV